MFNKAKGNGPGDLFGRGADLSQRRFAMFRHHRDDLMIRAKGQRAQDIRRNRGAQTDKDNVAAVQNGLRLINRNPMALRQCGGDVGIARCDDDFMAQTYHAPHHWRRDMACAYKADAAHFSGSSAIEVDRSARH